MIAFRVGIDEVRYLGMLPKCRFHLSMMEFDIEVQSSIYCSYKASPAKKNLATGARNRRELCLIGVESPGNDARCHASQSPRDASSA